METFITGRENVWELHYVADKLDVYLHLVARKMGDELIIQFTDFTKLKSLELELLKKIKELERSNRNLEEFAYAASHDLKEPIRKILFFSDLLRNSLNQRLSEKENHYFDRMDVAGKRMFSLIEDLLSFSQVNRQKPEPETADMNAVVRLVLEDLELEIAQQHATVLVDPLFTFKGYPRQLQQLFHNLIGNALKYSKPDVDPHITIAYTMTVGKDIPVQLSIEEQQQLFSVVTVTDNGIGFEQQNAERIFDVFTRLHGSDLVRGTGVGLAIVRKVMENHHGFVQANSELNIGTTFFLYFPLHG